MTRKKLRIEVDAALGGLQTEFSVYPLLSFQKDLDLTIYNLFETYVRLLRESLRVASKTRRAVKFHIKFHLDMEKFSVENKATIRIDAWFRSDADIIFAQDRAKIKQQVKKALHQVLSRYDSFVRDGSGWSLKNVIKTILAVNQFKPLQGGCEDKRLLPACLRDRRVGLLTFSYKKNQCFLSALAIAVGKQEKNPSRFCSYYKKLLERFPAKFLTFPVTLKDVQMCERMLPVSINIYGFDRVLFPYYISDRLDKPLEANLLLHNEHYWAIRNLSTLVRKGNRLDTRRIYVCRSCLSTFTNLERFQHHEELRLNSRSF